MKWYFNKHQIVCILCASIIVICIIVFQVAAATGKNSLEWAIEPRYEWLSEDFSEGVCYYAGSPAGYINHTGHIIYEFEENHYNGGYFSNGSVLVTLRPSGQKIGYLDRKTFQIRPYQERETTEMVFEEKKEKIPSKYETTGITKEGLTSVKTKEGWGFIDEEGNEIIKPQYNDYNGYMSFSEGYTMIQETPNKVFCINKKGEKIFTIKAPFQTSFTQLNFNHFIDGIYIIHIESSDGKEYSGVINAKGDTILSPKYDKITYGEGLLTAFKDENIYLYDTKGKLLIDFKKQYPEVSNLGSPSENCIFAEVLQINPETQEKENLRGFFKNPIANPSKWAEKEIIEAFTCSLIPETLAYNYQTPITKQEFAKLIIHLMQEIDFFEFYAAPLDTFKDTMDYSVLQLVKAGIIEQTKNQLFEPEKPISKEEAKQILQNTIDYLNINTTIDEITPQNDTSENYTREQAIITILNLYKKASP